MNKKQEELAELLNKLLIVQNDAVSIVKNLIITNQTPTRLKKKSQIELELNENEKQQEKVNIKQITKQQKQTKSIKDNSNPLIIDSENDEENCYQFYNKTQINLLQKLFNEVHNKPIQDNQVVEKAQDIIQRFRKVLVMNIDKIKEQGNILPYHNQIIYRKLRRTINDVIHSSPHYSTKMEQGKSFAKCFLCSYKNIAPTLISHILIKHCTPKCQIYFCAICNKDFQSHHLLTKHLNQHIKGEKIQIRKAKKSLELSNEQKELQTKQQDEENHDFDIQL